MPMKPEGKIAFVTGALARAARMSRSEYRVSLEP
jgi:hypothetical protein